MYQQETITKELHLQLSDEDLAQFELDAKETERLGHIGTHMDCYMDIKDNLHQCDGKEQWLTIYDRYRKKFFVHSCCSDCVNEIYNGQPLWLGDETEALCHLHPKTYRIHLTKETPKEAAKILEAAKKVIEGKSESLGKEITKGHFRRGAL